jgi:glutaredoxin
MLTVYSKNLCSHCDQTKNYLKSKNINFREINIEQDAESKMTAEDILSEIELRNSLADQSL